MPTYEYQCKACQATLTVEQKISDKPLKKCKTCKKHKLQRLISGSSSFVLQGGGWYADGYTSSSETK